jgi:hypothetical protein
MLKTFLLLVATLTPLVLAAPLPRVDHDRNAVENIQAFGEGAAEELGDIVSGLFIGF